jgi:hypothetical protein
MLWTPPVGGSQQPERYAPCSFKIVDKIKLLYELVPKLIDYALKRMVRKLCL